MPPRRRMNNINEILPQEHEDESSLHTLPPSASTYPAPSTGIPPPPFDALRQLIEWWNVYGVHFQTPPQVQVLPSPPNPMVPPVPSMVSVAPPTLVATPSTQPPVKLSKLLKEARQLGCETFYGSNDPVVAKKWIKRVRQAVMDMSIDDEMKLTVAVRLLDEDASIWWDGVKERAVTPLTWNEFLREFDEKFYTQFDRDLKRREFLHLRQGSMSVAEYEAKFMSLSSFVPEMVASEECRCFKFENGLNLNIRERMSVARNHTYRDILQLALRAEQIVLERSKVKEHHGKKKRSGGFTLGQGSKKSKSTGSYSGGCFSRSVGTLQNQLFFKPNAPSGSVGSGEGKKNPCTNCKGYHSGLCRGPRRCYHCGKEGHFRHFCPELNVEGQGNQQVRGPSSGFNAKNRDRKQHCSRPYSMFSTKGPSEDL